MIEEDLPESMYICTNCIGEKFLKNEINNLNLIEKCNYCGTTDKPTTSLDELAEELHIVLSQQFNLTPEEPTGYEAYLHKDGLWERAGDLIEDVIQDVLDVDTSIGIDIREYLSDEYDSRGEDSLMEQQPYSIDAQYQEKPIDSVEFTEVWREFKSSIHSEARFFNNNAIDSLKWLFNGISELKNASGEPVVRVYTNDDEFFRSRVALTVESLVGILENLPSSLGPPPSGSVSAGRMNADGISVFYGGLDKTTCVAEVRAPVGSTVVTGRFKPLRDVRVLDLSLLQKCRIEGGSYFDKHHIESLSRISFLEALISELSAPILPGREADYLPTQVLAEYLALTHEDLDGLVFNSSQVDKSDDNPNSGKNIVLFQRSSSLAKSDSPKGATSIVNIGSGHPEEGLDEIRIVEKLINSKTSNPLSGLPFMGRANNNESAIPHEPTLRLDLESVEVDDIAGIHYREKKRPLTRYKEYENKRQKEY
jgi:RES domain-containing protein/HEPN superfamily RES-like protein